MEWNYRQKMPTKFIYVIKIYIFVFFLKYAYFWPQYFPDPASLKETDRIRNSFSENLEGCLPPSIPPDIFEIRKISLLSSLWLDPLNTLIIHLTLNNLIIHILPLEVIYGCYQISFP